MGIIRRVKTEGPDRTHRTSDLDRMHKSVRNRLTDLIDRVRMCWCCASLSAGSDLLVVILGVCVYVSLQVIAKLLAAGFALEGGLACEHV